MVCLIDLLIHIITSACACVRLFTLLYINMRLIVSIVAFIFYFDSLCAIILIFFFI